MSWQIRGNQVWRFRIYWVGWSGWLARQWLVGTSWVHCRICLEESLSQTGGEKRKGTTNSRSFPRIKSLLYHHCNKKNSNVMQCSVWLYLSALLSISLANLFCSELPCDWVNLLMKPNPPSRKKCFWRRPQKTQSCLSNLVQVRLKTSLPTEKLDKKVVSLLMLAIQPYT